MKTFYTERDIVDVFASGVTELEVDDSVVLTDLAREKAAALGLRLKHVERYDDQTERILRNLGAQLSSSTASPGPSASISSAVPGAAGITEADDDLVQRVKAGVIAKLGTNEFNGLLDQVIPQILAQLNLQSDSSQRRGDR